MHHWIFPKQKRIPTITGLDRKSDSPDIGNTVRNWFRSNIRGRTNLLKEKRLKLKFIVKKRTW
jgi:hypothetical protein